MGDTVGDKIEGASALHAQPPRRSEWHLTMGKRPFPYDHKRRRLALKDRVRAYQSAAAFDAAVRQAWKRNIGPLCDYLRSDLPLAEDQREVLATLLERWVRRQKRPDPTREAEGLIVYLARKKLDGLRAQYRAQTGKSQLPKGTINKIIEEIGAQLAEDGALQGLNVRHDAIRKELLRGIKRQAPKQRPA